MSGKRLAGAIGVAMLAGAALSPPPARAAYIVTLTEEGSDVVAVGHGTLNTTGLTFVDSIPVGHAVINPYVGQIMTGPAGFVSTAFYSGAAGPTNFGSGSSTNASIGAGNIAGIIGAAGYLFVPDGYVSGSTLADVAFYFDQTFSSLGVTPGVYVWTWGNAVEADSFTLEIRTVAISETGSLALFTTGLVALIGCTVGHRTRQRAG
jgi:hypothetical protein